MGIDIFGRVSSQSNQTQFKGGSSVGPPGKGFKLTNDGQFDLDRKRLCNVAEPKNESDAVTYNTMKAAINYMDDKYKTVSQQVDNLMKTSKDKSMDQLKTAIKQELENVKAISEYNKYRITGLEDKVAVEIVKLEDKMTSKDPDLIIELTTKVSALENLVSNQIQHIEQLAIRVTTLVRSVVRDTQTISDIDQRLSKLEKHGK